MEEIKSPYNVWFISDIHYGHKNILYHQPQRIERMNLSSKDDIEGHDKWIIEMWNNTVKRGDHIYILGDLAMGDYESTRKFLHKIKQKGCVLHLIVGNHDKQAVKFPDMFNSIDLIKDVTFKKSVFPFLKENLITVMCHYPMKSWARKAHGSLMLYGHVHDNSPWLNDTDELTINVGLDAPMSNYGLISLEQVAKWYFDKIGDMTPQQYIDDCCKKNKDFVR